MSYVEDAIYTYIKKILTAGIIVLTNKRFLFYTITALLIPVLLTTYTFLTGGEEVTTTYNILFKLELAACVALIITGLLSFRLQLVKIEHLLFIIMTLIIFALSMSGSKEINDIENIFVYASFYSWIITTNAAGLYAIRDFIVKWPGWVLRLGDKEARIMFSPIVKIALFASIAWFIYSLWTNFSWSLLLAFFAGALIFYTIYILTPLTKDALLPSILSFYYFILLYHLFVRAEGSTGFLIADVIIIVATTIFTAQEISNLIASKKYTLPRSWDSLIIILLGMMMGYHLLALKIATSGGLKIFYSLYHDLSFGLGTIIMFIVIILYITNKKFRVFSQNQIDAETIFSEVANAGLDAVNNYASKIKESIKNKWSFELKKNKTNEEEQKLLTDDKK